MTAVSRFYRAPPWGRADQDWFLNACALGRTNFQPEALLERVKRLEVELGREPTERWGPRVIDIDLIAYDDIALKTERLTFPIPNCSTAPLSSRRWPKSRPISSIAGVRIGEAAARLGAEPGRFCRSTDGYRRIFALAPAARSQLNWLLNPSVPFRSHHPMDQKTMPAWPQTFTFLDGEWLEGNHPI